MKNAEQSHCNSASLVGREFHRCVGTNLVLVSEPDLLVVDDGQDSDSSISTLFGPEYIFELQIQPPP
jgi:hypothetical protein